MSDPMYAARNKEIFARVLETKNTALVAREYGLTTKRITQFTIQHANRLLTLYCGVPYGRGSKMEDIFLHSSYFQAMNEEDRNLPLEVMFYASITDRQLLGMQTLLGKDVPPNIVREHIVDLKYLNQPHYAKLQFA